MKTLNLIIKQKYFDAILSGEKTEEYREVRPTTFKKYLKYVVDGQEFNSLDDVPDDEHFNKVLDEEGFDVNPIDYDTIRFYVGYNKDRDSMLVEVKEIILEYLTDEDDEPIYFEYDGNEYIACNMVYVLGVILEKDVHEK